MIDCLEFLELLRNHELNIFAGVPDSLLRDFCACLSDYDLAITCADEGNAVALAAGHYLATGEIGVCYFQNSGLGNAYNPLVSLTHPDVYSIPVLLLIGWRGGPGMKDEPQHVVQGKITLPTLDLLGIRQAVLSPDISETTEIVSEAVVYMKTTNSPYALVVRSHTFENYDICEAAEPSGLLTREAALRVFISVLPPEARLVATTGRLSRELFELRDSYDGDHGRDFLTVGSMGHASSIALGIALHQPDRPVFCLDGDGAALMHLGAMATIGTRAPGNFYHILFNNGVHESVGNQPTAGPGVDFPAIALACGYKHAVRATGADEIRNRAKEMLTSPGPTFLEITINTGSRENLGRPTTNPRDNKTEFMNGLA